MQPSTNTIATHLFNTVRAAGMTLGGVAIAWLAAGCDKGGGAGGAPGSAVKINGAVGVVNLDTVIDKVGWKAEGDRHIDAAKSEWQKQGKVFVELVNKKWEDKKKEIGRQSHLTQAQLDTLNNLSDDSLQKLPLNKDQRDELVRDGSAVVQTLRGVDQNFQRDIQARTQQILQTYSTAISPVVRRVATASGFSTVIPSQGAVYSDPAVDLTDKVIDEISKAPPPHAVPEMPKFSPPDFNFPAAPASGGSSAAPTTKP